MNQSAISQVGSIHVTKDTVQAYYAAKGLDATELAKEWIAAWAAKVEPGTQMILAKMKCTLADGPCGCEPHVYVYKCTGPYPPVPMEIIIEVLFPKDGGPCAVEGVEGLELPAPEYFKGLGETEFLSATKAKYIKKV